MIFLLSILKAWNSIFLFWNRILICQLVGKIDGQFGYFFALLQSD